MKAREIHINQEFGNYKIISEPYYEGKHRKIQCQCKCGKIKIAYCGNLGQLTQCKKCSTNKSRKFKINQKVNNFTILKYLYDKIKDRSTYLVQCQCGSKPYKITSAELNKTKNCKECFSPLGNNHPAYKGTKNVSKTYYSQVLLGAKIRNLEFTISIEDMDFQFTLQNGLCNLSKLPILIGNEKIEGTASLDRIDSSKGYTKDNIQWLHKDINRMKTDFNQDYFYELCKLITEHKN